MSRIASLAAAFVTALLLCSSARADIGPVPTPCNEASHEDEDTVCVRCDPLSCDGLYGDTDYYHACTYDEPPAIPYELWCRSTEPVSCNVAATPLLPPLAGVGLLLTGAVILWWSRRRRP